MSTFRFLIQVSRPGLWSTTALFYLIPLGHWTAFRSPEFWAGLFYVLFPLGLVLYGVNDIADAEADRYNPRKGTFLFGSLGASDQLSALRWLHEISGRIPAHSIWDRYGGRLMEGSRSWRRS